MHNAVRVKALAVLVTASLGGLAATTAWSTPSFKLAADAAGVEAESTYLIEFVEPGALHYDGGTGQLRGTAPKAASGERFNAKSADVAAYRQFVQQQQQAHIASIASTLGRELVVTHSYDITHSGIAAKMTAGEAKRIAQVSGVTSVKIDELRHLDTYRGPEFIGAPTIWNGATPGGTTNRGKGIVIGVLDSGINSTHPSFANDTSCGFSAADPKLLSARDCASTSGNVCNGPNAEAVDSGHGVHTASTAGGNSVTNAATPSPNLPAPYTQMSGVAPCASIRSYKVCPGTTCPSSAITGGINNAIADGVDVINFSISGGTSPWSDDDRRFLDMVNAGIFVAASAGNTSATVTNPVGQVNHRGPWVMTVAASTQDKDLGPGLSATGPGTPPANTQNLLTSLGSHISSPTTFTNLPIRTSTNVEGCTASGGFPAGYFTGSVALIRRGTCNFTEKVANAAAAGAQQVFIYNNTFGVINMNTDGATIPAYSITQDAGTALAAFIATNGATPTTASLSAGIVGDVQGDVLGDFSFRGPTPGTLADLTKPDITAPGVSIYAAGRAADGNYYLESGTSMSGPHVAGAAALVRAVHPTWTPPEVKSALQMTAKRAGFKENGTTPWDIDDVGSGRADLTKAAAAGLVLNETYANFVAANPSGGSINVKQLNLASVRNMACNGNCTFTRTLTSKLGASSTWTASYVGSTPGVTVAVSPATFTVAAGGTQAITITASVTATQANPAFGYIVLTPQDAAQSPALHLTSVIKGQGVVDQIFKDGFDAAGGGGTTACLSVNGKTSQDEFNSGSPGNSVLTLNIGAGNAMTGASADVSIEALSPSWLSETAVTFSSSAAGDEAIFLTMSDTEASGTETNLSTDGVLLFADYGLGNIVAGSDGILRLEWTESFADDVSPNARWSNAASPVTCAGVHITCTNQAACDAAVTAAATP
ncbi:S8 family serine peptidase [Dokdonella sp. MW10]|uniref:S8 family serine peptidase n=1 Tax=Dokdonella sp. MW10 TaxID=2992926 RepID=UPI003F7E5CCF